MFEKFDANGSGFINVAEVGAMCAAMGLRLSGSQLAEALDEIEGADVGSTVCEPACYI